MTKSFFFPARREFIGRSTPSHVKLVEFYSEEPIPNAPRKSMEVELNGTRYLRTIIDLSSTEDLHSVQDHVADNSIEQGFIQNYVNFKPELPVNSKFVGIINCTPDSFYEGSRMYPLDEKVVDRMLDEKPDVVDIGGESTRPGSTPITWKEELKRIEPTVKYISETSSIPISLDTRNPETVEALSGDARLDYVNDVSGLSKPNMRKVVSRLGCNVVIMHMRGEPSNMHTFTTYNDVIAEIVELFFQRMELALIDKIRLEKIILDPGIGFAKGLKSNVHVLQSIDNLRIGFPLFVGASRKRFIGRITEEAGNRLPGTIACSIYLAQKKVDYIRVHDVADNKSAIEFYRILNGDLV